MYSIIYLSKKERLNMYIEKTLKEGLNQIQFRLWFVNHGLERVISKDVTREHKKTLIRSLVWDMNDVEKLIKKLNFKTTKRT